MAHDELLPLVDVDGRTIGSARRSQVHRDPSLMHPVVHCLVTDPWDRVLLQLRAKHKDIQPGRWDTSVGGHVEYGETVATAVVREIGEELGVAVQPSELRFLYRYVMRSDVETELVHSFRLVHAGPFRVEFGEIDELRFWDHSAIVESLGAELLTPNFEDEYRRFREWLAAAGP